jgi:hypothetical protein
MGQIMKSIGGSPSLPSGLCFRRLLVLGSLFVTILGLLGCPGRTPTNTNQPTLTDSGQMAVPSVDSGSPSTDSGSLPHTDGGLEPSDSGIHLADAGQILDASILGSDGGSAEDDGGTSFALVPDFALVDVNMTSTTYLQLVSPDDFSGQVSAWYFGHAT